MWVVVGSLPVAYGSSVADKEEGTAFRTEVSMAFCYWTKQTETPSVSFLVDGHQEAEGSS